MEQLQKERFNKLHIVLGMVDDKNLESVLPLFPKKAAYYFCKPDVIRGLDEVKLKRAAKGFGLIGEVYSSVDEAYKRAIFVSEKNDVIYIGGSTFVVAEVL